MAAVERRLRGVAPWTPECAFYTEEKFTLQRAPCFVEKAELAADPAEVGVRDHMVRTQPHRLAIALECGFELAFGVARGAEVIPRFGERGMETQRLAVARDRFVELAAVLQQIAEIVVVRGDARIMLDRAAQGSLRGVEAAVAPMFEALDMQRVGGIQLAAKCVPRA